MAEVSNHNEPIGTKRGIQSLDISSGISSDVLICHPFLTFFSHIYFDNLSDIFLDMSIGISSGVLF